jgi:small-conductance mechanosensitive channel
MHLLSHPFTLIGTAVVLVLAWILLTVGDKLVPASGVDASERYRRGRLLNTIIIVIAAAIIIALWVRLVPRASTFLGLVGAGLAVALREPLLSIAGRIAILAGHMYSIDDRIEINKLSGDVIDIGLFYTRMMEIGNWIGGDQYSGRIIQFSNDQVFGTPVFNYTRNFAYIWDEIKLPVTYDSDIKTASDILRKVGGEYTREFMQGAEEQVHHMQRVFMVPEFELKPSVFMKVTDNWVELTLRYLVDPRKRRSASSFIFSEVFQQIQQSENIEIASSTMTLTMKDGKLQPAENEQGPGKRAA